MDVDEDEFDGSEDADWVGDGDGDGAEDSILGQEGVGALLGVAPQMAQPTVAAPQQSLALQTAQPTVAAAMALPAAASVAVPAASSPQPPPASRKRGRPKTTAQSEMTKAGRPKTAKPKAGRPKTTKPKAGRPKTAKPKAGKGGGAGSDAAALQPYMSIFGRVHGDGHRSRWAGTLRPVVTA